MNRLLDEGLGTTKVDWHLIPGSTAMDDSCVGSVFELRHMNEVTRFRVESNIDRESNMNSDAHFRRLYFSQYLVTTLRNLWMMSGTEMDGLQPFTWYFIAFQTFPMTFPRCIVRQNYTRHLENNMSFAHELTSFLYTILIRTRRACQMSLPGPPIAEPRK